MSFAGLCFVRALRFGVCSVFFPTIRRTGLIAASLFAFIARYSFAHFFRWSVHIVISLGRSFFLPPRSRPVDLRHPTQALSARFSPLLPLPVLFVAQTLALRELPV